MDLRHGEATHHLDTGDAVYFDATTSHTYLCAGEEPANAVIVTMQGNAAQQHIGPGVRPASVRARTAFVNGSSGQGLIPSGAKDGGSRNRKPDEGSAKIAS